MKPHPYVVLSVAASLDGYIDDTSDTRVLLSNEEDFDRVDEERSRADAILVGANTIRTDNPRLLVRSARRQQQRIDTGRPAQPAKATLTRSGVLDPESGFFTAGDTQKIVYTSTGARMGLTRDLGDAAIVVDSGDPLDVSRILSDLAEREVTRLMVEGGGQIHTLFLSAGVADELQLVYAPLLIGESCAPRFVHHGSFPKSMRLAETRTMGDVVLLRYLIGHDDA